MKTYCVLAAILVVGIVVVLHRSFFCRIIYVYILVGWYRVKCEVVAIDLIAAVIRCIVGDDGIVVAVVLGEDRVEVVLYPEARVIPVAGNEDAEREFIFVLGDPVNLICISIGSIESPPLCFVITVIDFVVELY